MGSDRPLLIALDAPGALDDHIVGGKAAKLAQLTRAGFTVPRGFCLTTWAYEAFVMDAEIMAAIRMVLEPPERKVRRHVRKVHLRVAWDRLTASTVSVTRR